VAVAHAAADWSKQPIAPTLTVCGWNSDTDTTNPPSIQLAVAQTVV